MKRTSDSFLFVLCIIGMVWLYPWVFLFGLVSPIAIWAARFIRPNPLKKLTISPRVHDTFWATEVWAKRHGFHYVGIFHEGTVNIAIWENAERATFLTLNLVSQTPLYKFNTFFDESITLETGNKRERLCLPYLPGNFVQIFTDTGLHPLWEQHIKAESWLTNDENVTLTPYRSEFP